MGCLFVCIPALWSQKYAGAEWYELMLHLRAPVLTKTEEESLLFWILCLLAPLLFHNKRSPAEKMPEGDSTDSTKHSTWTRTFCVQSNCCPMFCHFKKGQSVRTMPSNTKWVSDKWTSAQHLLYFIEVEAVRTLFVSIQRNQERRSSSIWNIVLSWRLTFLVLIKALFKLFSSYSASNLYKKITTWHMW